MKHLSSVYISLITALALVGSALGGAANIQVVYPREGQLIRAVDSSFIFGSVEPGWEVSINGEKINTHRDGGWLAFLPLTPGEFVFEILATKKKQATDSLLWETLVPELPTDDQYDTLRIFPDSRLPNRKQSLVTGDVLQLQFRGQPGCVAWAEIPGVVDSVPMIESDGIPAPFYDRSVFETIEDSAAVRLYGVYQGMFTIDNQFSSDSLSIIYHLTTPTSAQLLAYLRERPAPEINFNLLHTQGWRPGPQMYTAVSDTSKIPVAMNSGEFPRTIMLTDTTQIMRVGPRRGYLGLFQPAGVRALAVGYDGGWYKIKLSETRYGYVNDSDAVLLKPGILPPHSRLTSWKAEHEDRQTIIRAQLSAQHPFSITEPDPRTLVVELFGVEMDTDWFRYDFSDRYLRNATWTQPEPNLYRLELRFKKPFWGYKAKYAGTVFELTLIYPPKNVKSLKGKRIVIDPGHSPDVGSVGPTGYTEAEANLKISLILRDELRKRGAIVIMTRDDSSSLPLYDRPKIADSLEGDLFVSIHNNALPDGVNPFENYGVSTYYYHNHSLALTRWIHQEMLKLPQQRDHGLYHGNLAVCRSTTYPSVLVECGFMIIPEQEKWLKTNRYRKQVAKAITKGIAGFLRNYGR